DLTVETFWRVYRARGRFDPAAGNFRAWARRIATNAALDHLRHARKETELPEDFPAAPRGDPAAQGELRGRLRRAFLELPSKYRLVATLALIEDEPYQEIADAVGISPAQTTRLSRRSHAAQKTQFSGRGGQRKMTEEMPDPN